MDVTIELSPEQETALKARAGAHGLNIQEWLLRLVEESVPRGANPEGKPHPPFWKKILDEVHSLPSEAFDGLPEDGASEHDHYLYGSPKRNQ